MVQIPRWCLYCGGRILRSRLFCVGHCHDFLHARTPLTYVPRTCLERSLSNFVGGSPAIDTWQVISVPLMRLLKLSRIQEITILMTILEIEVAISTNVLRILIFERGFSGWRRRYILHVVRSMLL